MKKFFIIIFLLSLPFFPISAQNSGKQEVPKENSTKIRDIKRMMEISGSGDLGMQVLTNMIDSYKKSLPNIPQTFWDNFIKEVNAESLVELVIPIYDKYLSHDEIKDIIRFYESPSGRKLVKVLPMITEESMDVGRKWGEGIGKKLIEKLQNEAEGKNQ